MSATLGLGMNNNKPRDTNNNPLQLLDNQGMGEDKWTNHHQYWDNNHPYLDQTKWLYTLLNQKRMCGNNYKR